MKTSDAQPQRQCSTPQGCAQPVSATEMAHLQESAEKACLLLKALAHKDRLVLLCVLTQGEFCVSELQSRAGIRQPSLSQQLGVLRQEGLVETRRDGKQIYYRLASDDALSVLLVLHARICGAAIA